MQVNKYKLLIPVSPDSINQAIQYGKSDGDVVKLKKKWEKLAMIFIDDAQADGTLPDRFFGKIGVKFNLYFGSARRRDGDNYEAMCKGIIDALVAKRLVPDDNCELIDDDGRRLRIDPDRPRVELYIKDRIPDGVLADIVDYQDPGVEINYGGNYKLLPGDKRQAADQAGTTFEQNLPASGERDTAIAGDNAAEGIATGQEGDIGEAGTERADVLLVAQEPEIQ